MRAEQIVAFLQHQMPQAADIAVENIGRIAGGASRETWSFDARWTEDGATVERGFIARRDPPASLLSGNNDLEFEVYGAMAETGVPIPPVYWIEREGKWIDRPFFVMGRLPGASDGRQLVTSPQYKDVVPIVTEQKPSILARIHDFDIDRLHALERPPAGVAPAAHEVARWEQTLREDALEPQPVLELAFAWLKRHLPPPPERLALVHGDYRTGNFLYDASGITGILDWEMAHAGDPIEDVGWVVMKSWRWAGDDRVGGLCSRDEFVRRYEEASGRRVDPEVLRFWEIFGNVKFATLFLTGAKSIVQGKSPDYLLAVTAFLNPGLEAQLLELIA